jgi:porphobilinogen synthase
METIIYPITARRLRADIHIRELTASVNLNFRNFIQPIFVDEAIDTPREVIGLPDVFVDTFSSVINTIENDLKHGISKFLLFPVPRTKSLDKFDFSFAVNVIKSLRQAFGDKIWIASDLCLCSYTTHGHCGILDEAHSRVLNNKTVTVLSTYATQLAIAGADCIAPSDMMDGRIGAIRAQLDALGLDAVSIMSYAAKFSSQFYGPFRDACHSAPKTNGLQNRKTYQVSPLNTNDAIGSALRDEKEGADILMVKPAGLYTDIIAILKQKSLKPIAAYHVSGEYAAIEGLVSQGLADREAIHIETWAALQRSGADIIISYAARNAKKWLENINY